MDNQPTNSKFSLVVVIIASTGLAITNAYVIESVKNIHPIAAIALAGLIIFQIYYAVQALNRLRRLQ